MLNRESEVSEAASFLLSRGKSTGPWRREVAKRALNTTSNAPVEPNEESELEARSFVRNFRQLLRTEPRDPISWVELSRAYVVLGHLSQAAASMDTALALAPENRFVLRSATRLWIHLKEPDKAHGILMRSPATRRDPWLLAAEIASAQIAGRGPRLAKVSRSVLEDWQLDTWHLSELASALGTLELRHNNLRRARKLFAKSLEKPTENSVAQAEWAFRKGYAIHFDDGFLKSCPNSYEAHSRASYQKGRWKEVLGQCNLWQRDQPFSSQPGALGSFVAAVALTDYSATKKFAERSLVANPRDAILLNNLAFAQINLGELDDAENTLSRLKTSNAQEIGPTITATRGLLQFRKGNVDSGRMLYGDAIEKAKAKNDKRSVALATMFHALEEFSQTRGDIDPDLLMTPATELLAKMSDPLASTLSKRLEKIVRKR